MACAQARTRDCWPISWRLPKCAYARSSLFFSSPRNAKLKDGPSKVRNKWSSSYRSQKGSPCTLMLWGRLWWWCVPLALAIPVVGLYVLKRIVLLRLIQTTDENILKVWNLSGREPRVLGAACRKLKEMLVFSHPESPETRCAMREGRSISNVWACSLAQHPWRNHLN